MKIVYFILLGLTLFSIALGCGGDSNEDESDPSAGTGSPGASGATATGGSGGNAIVDSEPFFCGTTQCTQLEPTDGGMGNILSFGLRYCCTDTKNVCSVQLIGSTSCPDTVICGGQECRSMATDIGTLVGTGMVCCSPSERCSVMAIGETQCPEPDDLDPDCPSVSDSFGDFGSTIEESGFGGQGCCLPSNTCGLIFMGSCVPTLAETFPGLGNTPVYDCDGNLIEPVITDASVDMDAASNTDAAVEDEDSGS